MLGLMARFFTKFWQMQPWPNSALSAKAPRVSKSHQEPPGWNSLKVSCPPLFLTDLRPSGIANAISLLQSLWIYLCASAQLASCWSFVSWRNVRGKDGFWRLLRVGSGWKYLQSHWGEGLWKILGRRTVRRGPEGPPGSCHQAPVRLPPRKWKRCQATFGKHSFRVPSRAIEASTENAVPSKGTSCKLSETKRCSLQGDPWNLQYMHMHNAHVRVPAKKIRRRFWSLIRSPKYRGCFSSPDLYFWSRTPF